MSQVETITAKLNSTINDVKRKSLKTLAIEARVSVDKNFDDGGRPKWEPRKRISKKQKGRNILVISGRMRNISETVENDRVVLKSNPLARAYSAIQHLGGTIVIPAGKKRLRKMEKMKSGKYRYQFAKDSHKRGIKEVDTKAHTITIPPRPWMVIPPVDFPRIIQAIKTAISI